MKTVSVRAIFVMRILIIKQIRNIYVYDIKTIKIYQINLSLWIGLMHEKIVMFFFFHNFCIQWSVLKF